MINAGKLVRDRVLASTTCGNLLLQRAGREGLYSEDEVVTPDSEQYAEVGAGDEALLDVCNTRLCCLWMVVRWRVWFRSLVVVPSERMVVTAAVAAAGVVVAVVVSCDVALLAGPCVVTKLAAAEVCHPEWTQHRRADRRPARGDMQHVFRKKKKTKKKNYLRASKR